MDPRQLRALNHPILIKGWIEKANVISNRAGEELILLHHRSDVLAIGPGPDRCEGDVIDQHLPSGRLQQPEHDGPIMVTNSPGSMIKLISSRTKGSASA